MDATDFFMVLGFIYDSMCLAVYVDNVYFIYALLLLWSPPQYARATRCPRVAA